MKKTLLLSSLLLLILGAQAQNTCVQPVITQVSGAGTYCPGEEVTLEVTGTLNNATQWSWYASSCNGQAIATGTSLKVKVEKSVTYYVRGTGGCVGATATCASVEIKRDDVGPTILTAPQDTVVVNDEGECGAIVSFDPPTGEDSCSDTVIVKQVAGLESGSLFPVGKTTVTYELSDTIGNVTTWSFDVTVADEELPVITCVENIEVNNDPGLCGAIVTYDVPVGTDNCPDAVTTLTEGLGSGAFFPVGVTTETYTVTDASGNVSSCSFTVTVVDNEPPVITVNNKQTRLWPPNHKHHDIFIDDYIESVTDNCGSITIDDVVIEEIGSDEPNNGKGDGNTTDDIVIADECRTAKLLAERSGTGNGRVYVVTLAVKDLHGNIGRAEFIVEVPHDMGKKNSIIRDSIVYSVSGCDLTPSDTTTTASASNNAGRTNVAVETDFGVYPNPFNRSFSIQFTPRVKDHVKVELYDLMGRRIAELHEQTVEADTLYEWNFEPAVKKGEINLLIIRGNNTYGTKRLIQKD